MTASRPFGTTPIYFIRYLETSMCHKQGTENTKQNYIFTLSNPILIDFEDGHKSFCTSTFFGWQKTQFPDTVPGTFLLNHEPAYL